MPGYVIHIAIAKQYEKKHKNIKDIDEFIKGTISPDLTDKKSLTHYGKSPAYTDLNEFFKYNDINTDFKKGYFLHLIADYLFYNHYIDRIEKPQIYNDYDYTNKELIEKYHVILPDIIKDKVFFKKGMPQILSFELACKVIDEISSLDIESIENEVKQGNTKWNTYKNLI